MDSCLYDRHAENRPAGFPGARLKNHRTVPNALLCGMLRRNFGTAALTALPKSLLASRKVKHPARYKSIFQTHSNVITFIVIILTKLNISV